MSSCGNPATEIDALMPRRVKFDKSKFCVKCKTTLGNIVIRHAVYCKDCFFALITSRFRRTLGPTINPTPDGPRRVALKASGNLLLAFSGGLGSTVLLDLVSRNYFTTAKEAGRKNASGGTDHPRNGDVWTKVAVCYVEVCSAFPEMRDRTAEIRAVVEGYDRFAFIPLRLEDAFDRSWWEKTGRRPLRSDLGVDVSNEDLIFSSISSTSNPVDPVARLKSYIAALPTQTAIPTTVQTLIRLLLLHTAHSTGSSHLLLGTSLTSLSIALVSSISQGGGFAVQEESQEEWRDDETGQMVRVNRPLREVGVKECAAWAWWTALRVVGQEKLPEVKQGIGALTKDFIMGLERDFPSTVSTIARTCGKLAPKEGADDGSCVLCERPVQRGVQDWKKRISIRSVDPPGPGPGPGADQAPVPITLAQSSQPLLSLTPHLCYACHTTLTSRSSRGSTTPGSKAAPPGAQRSVALPVWVRSRLDGVDFPCEDGGDATAGEPAVAVFEVGSVGKKMSAAEMKRTVSDFLIDDTRESPKIMPSPVYA